MGVRALEPADLVAAEPGGTHPQVRGNRPQVSDEVGRLEQRPRPVEDGEQLPVPRHRPAEQVGRYVGFVLVLQDGEQFLPDLVAGLVVRGTGLRRVERHGPVAGAQVDVGPVGGDGHRLGGRFLVEPDGLLDRLRHADGRLQAGHLRIRLGRGRGPFVDEVPQDAGLNALLAEAGQDVGDVGQVGPVRADEQHTSPAVLPEARVGVEQVGGAVQGDDGLAGARAAVDDEGAAGTGADDGVLVGLDGGEHVPHPGRAVGAQAGDEGGLVVQRGVPGQAVRGEHLVPVVADPAVGPAVSAAARQAHRVGVGGSEERLGGGGTPVDQQSASLAVRETEPSHVHGLGVVRTDHVPEAQVQSETAQGAQPGGQPVDLRVPVHRLPSLAAGCLPFGLQTARQLGDRLLQTLGDGSEVPLVAGDRRRVGLGRQAVGKIERAGGQGVHVRHSHLRRSGAWAGHSAAGRGPCRKAPCAL